MLKQNIVKLILNFVDDCTFLIESPPGSQMEINGTIKFYDKSMGWLKLYDFYSNTTLVPFGE